MPIQINNVTRRVVYAPTGTGGAGPYAFTFEILAAGDIAVYKDDVLLTLTTHYTVTINANGTGSVTITAAGLALAPTSPTQYAIVGNRTIQRTTDYVTGGDFFANTLNDELDQQTIFAQQNAEGLQRALQAPQTDPTTINMILPRSTVRANKVLSFDSSGNPSATEFIGSNRGNWASGTLYYVRDIVKDTSNSNIWQCVTQHTSSGSQPINTNTDAAKWTLLVDAASAATSATNAANSATAAATSATSASNSASSASTSATNAASSASSASTSASNASTSASTASTQATNASNSATAAATSASNASTSASNAASSASSASTSASNASTSATNAASSASSASTSASNAATSATNASNSASSASTSATNAASSATAAQTAQTAAEAALDSFDDRYLGAKSANPTVDNDGNALITGALHFNTTAGEMRIWNGSAWVAATVSPDTISIRSFTATAGQTSYTFTGGYRVGYLFVYVNGALLDPSEITATDGTTVTFGTALALNDEVTMVTFKAVGSVTIGDITGLQTALDGKVAKAGDTMTGALIVDVSSTSAALRITQTGSGNALLVEDSTNPDSTPFVIDASGNVIKGATAAITSLSGITPGFQVVGTSLSPSSLGLFNYSNSSNASFITFAKSRNASIDGQTIVADGDNLMTLRAYGSDGTNFIQASQIRVEVDGTPGTNDMPGRLVFSTTADGASSVSERMRIDSSGRVLVNKTSWSGDAKFVVGPDVNGSVARLAISSNTTGDNPVLELFEGTTRRVFLNYDTTNNIANLTTEESGSALAFQTNSTERMRIDSSGNVGIGTSSPSTKLSLQLSSATTYTTSTRTNQGLTIYNSSATTNGFTGIEFAGEPTSGNGGLAGIGSVVTGSGSANLVFGTRDSTTYAERARITSGGFFKASNAGTYQNTAGTYHELRSDVATDNTVLVDNTNASSPYGVAIRFINATPNNTTNTFLRCEDSTNDKCFIFSSGTVTNRTGTYNAFSDIKLKQDIVDANSQWNDIKALRVVKYRLKDEVAADPNYPAYIGLVAQEVEQVSAGLVEDYPDFETVTRTREVEKTREVEVTPAVLDEDGNVVEPAVMETETYTEEEEYTERVATGTVTKGVKYSILYMKSVKALQEAMARIETLEAQNAAFETRLAALEGK